MSYNYEILRVTIDRISGNIDSDFNLAIWQTHKIAKLTYAIIDPFILQAWVSVHTVLKSTNLKSRQQHVLANRQI